MLVTAVLYIARLNKIRSLLADIEQQFSLLVWTQMFSFSELRASTNCSTSGLGLSPTKGFTAKNAVKKDVIWLLRDVFDRERSGLHTDRSNDSNNYIPVARVKSLRKSPLLRFMLHTSNDRFSILIPSIPSIIPTPLTVLTIRAMSNRNSSHVITSYLQSIFYINRPHTMPSLIVYQGKMTAGTYMENENLYVVFPSGIADGALAYVLGTWTKDASGTKNSPLTMVGYPLQTDH
ncbi:hypothetical protein EDB87DRAFT_1835985 [Lactarius vividus]|nr:hypothetical protein EDB87DRAFT_1835985 [Lactarius vividus]